MGDCTSHIQKAHHRSQGPPIDAVPPDTDFLKGAALPVLAFYVLISDIKLKKCPYDRIALRFVLPEIDSFTTPYQAADRQMRVYWKVVHAFDFYMTEYQLRNRFLLVEAIDLRGEKVAGLKMNMFTLWTGPYHQDFALKTGKSGNCRISFNAKISQGVHLTISNTFTQMVQSEEEVFAGDRFGFSMQAVLGQQLQEQSCPYVVKVKRGQQEQNEQHLVQRSCIKWQSSSFLVKFDKKIAYYEIYSSSLHLIFYKVIKPLTISTNTTIQYEPISECFIPLRKLITLDYLQFKDPTTNITYLQRNVQLIEKTWLHGKEIGKARLRFNFSMQAYLKQMQACVRTEEGIMISSPVFSQKSGAHECEEITALGKLNTQIQNEFVSMEEAYEQFNMAAMRQNGLRISTLLTRQLALLQKSSKQSMLLYEYKNQTELFQAQRFLIDLAFKALAYVHEDKPDICEVSWSLLTTILKRGEFRLGQMGFSQQEIQTINNGKSTQKLRLKLQVAIKYQQLLNNLLKQTLALLGSKGDESQRTFAESFCAYAYFRIPAFRDLIVSSISRQDDPEIAEWRGTEVNLYESHNGKEQKGEDFYQLHFDWEYRFFRAIANEDPHKRLNSQLQLILKEMQWRTRMGKRGGAFYSFLQNLVQQIEYVSVVSKYIRWHYLPGYNHLLRVFLVEMKERRISDYPQRMKKAAVKLLYNQRLLNVFVVLLLKKTNLNDPSTVQTTISMIDSFFKSLKEHQRPIPSTFDYHFFLEGLKIVLNSELQFCISLALLLIYNNLFTFSQQFGLQLCLYLLSGPFFKFFFHWSQNLRQIFHLLIICRINRYQQDRLTVTVQQHNLQTVYTMSLKVAIKERVEQLMTLIKKEEGRNPSGSVDSLLQKDLYRKMRYRMKQKRKEHHQGSSVMVLEDISLPDFRMIKSSTNSGKVAASKLIYFRDQEMTMVAPTKELRYVKVALNEYSNLLNETQNTLKKDPNFTPEIKLKRIIDENEIGPAKIDEW